MQQMISTLHSHLGLMRPCFLKERKNNNEKITKINNHLTLDYQCCQYHDTRLLLLSQEHKTPRKICIYISLKNMPYFFFCTNQRSQSQEYIQGLEKKRKEKTTKEHTWKTLLSN